MGQILWQNQWTDRKTCTKKEIHHLQKKSPGTAEKSEHWAKKKKQAWNKCKKIPNPESWSIYTRARNNLTHTIENRKSEYENKIASEIKSYPKQFWKYVSSKTKCKGKISALIDREGNLATDDSDKAEVLNHHFASVFTIEDTSYIPPINIPQEDLTILDHLEITSEKIIRQLSELNISKSPGPDGLNTKVLKETASQTGPALKIIYNRSLLEGTLPHQWKEAHFLALFKKAANVLLTTTDQLATVPFVAKLWKNLYATQLWIP